MAGNKNSGNRTNHPGDNAGNKLLTARAKAKALEIEEAKDTAALYQVRRWNNETIPAALENVAAYIEKQIETGEPVTLAGCRLAAGMNRDIWYRLKAGDLDHLQVMEPANRETSGNREMLNIPYSEQIEKVYTIIEDQTEARLYKSGKVGDIFALKALHAWDDGTRANTPGTVNNTLVIADKEQAAAAIKLLK